MEQNLSETNLFIRSVKDFLTLKMLKYSLLPFILTAIFVYVVFFILIGIGVEQMQVYDVTTTQIYMQDGIPHTETITAKLGLDGFIKFLTTYAITSWVATFFVYFIGFFVATFASIFVAIIIIGFLTPSIMKELQARHYQDIEMIGYSNIIAALINMIKWSIIMLLLFILLVPLYFIPFVNILAFNLPLYYFFHKMITYDVSSTLCTAEEAKQVKYFAKNSIRAKTLLLYLISLIPFAIFFGAVFYVIYIGNTYFEEVKKIRGIN